jgi:hypothetical protein
MPRNYEQRLHHLEQRHQTRRSPGIHLELVLTVGPDDEMPAPRYANPCACGAPDCPGYGIIVRAHRLTWDKYVATYRMLPPEWCIRKPSIRI